MKREELLHLKSLSEKDPLVKKILDFYMGVTMNGVEAIRVSLNSQLLQLNEDMAKPDCNYDITLGRINDIAKTLKKLPKKETESSKPKEAKEQTGSFMDNAADDKRNE